MEELICLRKMRMKHSHDRRYIDSCDCGENELFLTIADGDFAFSKVIENEVIDSVKTRSLAYSFLEEDSKREIIKYYEKHYGLTINGNHILFGNGVLYWIQLIIKAFSKKGDNILSLAPVYDSFKDIVEDAWRVDLKSHLVFDGKEYKIDFEDLETKMQKSKVFILCSPHNPTGNVWTKEELTKILSLAKKHNVIVAADEIWQDIIIEGEFVSSLEFEEFKDLVIHISSPAKTFNLGGIQMGMCVIKNHQMLDQVKQEHISTIHYSSSNHWTSHAIQAAYGSSYAWAWFEKYMSKIKENAVKIKACFDRLNLQYSQPRATYLVFVNLGDQHDHDQIHKILTDNGLHLGDGMAYGEQYANWVRINIAICDKSMKLLMGKLEKVVAKLNK